MSLVFSSSQVGPLSVNNSLGQFLFGGLSETGCFFLLVIYSCKSASSKHIFILIARVRWMEMPFMPSWPRVFKFGTFSSVTQSEWSSIVAFGPSVLSTLLQCCLPIRFFCYILYIPIFYSKIVLLPSYSVVGISSYLFPLLAGRIFFRCFGMFCFACIV